MTDSVKNEEELEVEEGIFDDEPPAESGTEGEGASEDAPEQVTAEGDDGPSGPDETVEHGEGASELTAMREELEDLNDKHLRLAAEFNNFRRRSEQERLGAWARAQADVVGKFLDVLDDLNRVADLDLTNATVEAIIEGVDLVERKFVRMLEDSGVEVIDPVGEAFDPERMEAMMRVPAESDDQDDEVAQVFQKGYSLKGILVRPARVSVFKNG